MISFISKWIEQITISVIIVSIFEMILPNGNLKKYIKVVLGIYIIFSIISPFVDSKALYKIETTKVDKFIDEIEENSQKQISSSNIDARLEKLYIKEIEEDISKRVKEYGYKVNKCEIDADLKNKNTNSGIHKIKLILEEEKIGKIQEVNISANQANDEKSKTMDEVDLENVSESEEEKDINNLKKLSNSEKIKQNLAKNYNISEEIIKIKMK